MTAIATPDTTSVTDLLESVQPPCDCNDVDVRDGVVVSRKPCSAPAKWIVKTTFGCGTAATVACCDRHYNWFIAPRSFAFCAVCRRLEYLDRVTAEAL